VTVDAQGDFRAATSSDERRARFEALFAATYEPLQRYVRRRCSASAADDLVAEALLVLWRRLDEVPVGDEIPWSFGVARRCLANHERGTARGLRLARRVASERPPAGDNPPDPGLHEAIARLPSSDQELLRLWAWEELAPREIAVALDITPNAVSIRLHRAKARLAAALGAQRRTDRARDGEKDGENDPGTHGKKDTAAGHAWGDRRGEREELP
jgi:RNA polymerase sigma-70 factor (ECF subfamily)